MTNHTLTINLASTSPKTGLVRSTSVLTPSPVPRFVFGDTVGLEIILADGAGGVSALSGDPTVTIRVAIGQLGDDPLAELSSMTAGGASSSWTGNLNLNTSELDAIFSVAGVGYLNTVLEVEITKDALPVTILQADTVVTNQIITTGGSVPTPIADTTYMTNAQLAGWLKVAGTSSLAGSVRMGDSTTPNWDSALYITRSYTGQFYQYGIRNFLNATSSTNNSANNYGLTTTVAVDAAFNTGSIYGSQAVVTKTGAASSGGLYGALGQVVCSAGSCTSGYGGYFTSNCNGGSASSMIGIRVDNFLSSGTVSNIYGLYISPTSVTGGSVTNQYGIYQGGASDINVFIGQARFGSNVTPNVGNAECVLAYKGTSSNSSEGYPLIAERQTFSTSPTTRIGALFGHMKLNAGLDAAGQAVGVYARCSVDSNAANTGTNAAIVAHGMLQTSATATVSTLACIVTRPYKYSTSGTLTNSYGLLLQPASSAGGSITNRWGIYQEGTIDQNYFAGPTTFANTTVTNDPWGCAYQSFTGTATVLTTLETYYAIGGTYTVSGTPDRVTVSTSNGRLTPSVAGTYQVTWTWCGACDTANQQIYVGVGKNGTLIAGSDNEFFFDTTGKYWPMSGTINVSLNGSSDYVSLIAKNKTSGGATISNAHIQILVKRIGS
jgi:hypothetical protein